MLIAFHKPYGVLSQFTDDASSNRTLAEFGFPKNIYPIGRLDADSEGLLLLSDEPAWNGRLLHPRHAHGRELPEGKSALLYSLGFVVATGLLHAVGILLGVARGTVPTSRLSQG